MLSKNYLRIANTAVNYTPALQASVGRANARRLPLR